MNDMLEMYPKDKRLLYLAGNWLMGENGDDQAQRMMEKALTIDKNYPRRSTTGLRGCKKRRFAKAFSAMDRYVALLPQERTRKTPTENFCAWQAPSSIRWSTIAQH